MEGAGDAEEHKSGVVDKRKRDVESDDNDSGDDVRFCASSTYGCCFSCISPFIAVEGFAPVT